MSVGANQVESSPPAPSAAAQPVRESAWWLKPRIFFAALGGWLVVHLIFSARSQLVPDEAYYWVWSRHLALSYLDHPPMVAYLIRLGTAMLGQTELGVRLFMLLLTASAMLIVAWSARRLIPGDREASAFVAVAMLCSPIFSIVGAIATPDTPAIFFQTAALAVLLSIFAPRHPALLVYQKPDSQPFESLNRRHQWLAFGLLLGLSLVSKYTGALLGLAVLLALLSSAEGRDHLRTPWPWLGAILSVVVFSPVICWNAQHNWASFGFQLGHAGVNHKNTFTLRYLGDFIGGQALLFTPVLFGLCVFVLAVYWFRRNQPAYLRILLFSATVPLAVVGISALRGRPQLNWPVFAFIPAILLVGCYLSADRTKRMANIARLGIAVALFCTVVIHVPQIFFAAFPQLAIDRWDEQRGWRELAGEVARRSGGLHVITNKYQDASELAFYLPQHPTIFPVRNPYPTEFEFLPGYQPPDSFERLIVVIDLSKTGPVVPGVGLPPNFEQRVGFPLEVSWGKHIIRRSMIAVAERENVSLSHSGLNPDEGHTSP